MGEDWETKANKNPFWCLAHKTAEAQRDLDILKKSFESESAYCFRRANGLYTIDGKELTTIRDHYREVVEPREERERKRIRQAFTDKGAGDHVKDAVPKTFFDYTKAGYDQYEEFL